MWPPLVALLLLAGSSSSGGVVEALSRENAGDDAGAQSMLERISREHPQWDLPHREVGRLVLKRGGDLALAQYHLDIARSLAPEIAESHYLFGLLRLEQHAPEDAASALAVAATLRPENADIRYRLGQVDLELGRVEAAEREFRVIKQLRPTWGAARVQLALVEERLGRALESERELLELRTEQPEFEPARRQLVALYLRTGRPELARRLEEAPGRPLRALPRSRR